MAGTNYGSTVTKGGTTIGKCYVTSYPSISVKEIDVSNHSSSGKAQTIPGKLLRYGNFTLSIEVEDGTLIGMESDMASRSVEEIVITDGEDIFTFDGYYKEVQKEAADAQNEDVIKVTATLAVAGDLVITDASP